ncbi:YtxH domain-containing protein [Micrococcus cohnii]|uniref:YtxH domain-containing protein n=1 Tax=Micrococcus cohnii TaxID=993416 RepID=A0A7W7GQH5_9MICC|nr:YtxH domain-containing protein [Micrococcus cohnii]MBB4736430.1 hypothetical protein [Micrococcus cohnii]
MRLFTLGLGAALGYLIGSREGRENLNKMRNNAQQYWNDPKTQERVQKVQGNASQKWQEAKQSEKVQNVTTKVGAKVDETKGKLGATTDNLKNTSSERQENSTSELASGKNADPDVVSDPSTSLNAEGPNA